MNVFILRIVLKKQLCYGSIDNHIPLFHYDPFTVLHHSLVSTEIICSLYGMDMGTMGLRHLYWVCMRKGHCWMMKQTGGESSGWKRC